ncbi:hypothetical protein Tco_0696993 [Tanacetum coccineum]
MRSDELYKFSDRTLTGLRTLLDDITKNIRMEYLPKRRWSTLEKKRANIMIKAIDKQLKERRLMRSLEKFVDPHGFKGYLKMEVEVPDSSCLTRSIATCSYPIDKHKDFMKGSNTYFKTSATLIPNVFLQVTKNHKSTRWQSLKMAKRLCLVDDLRMLKITMSNTSSRNKLNPEIKDHYNIFTRESQEYELKTKDEA